MTYGATVGSVRHLIDVLVTPARCWEGRGATRRRRMAIPNNVCSQFLNWQEALDGLAEVKRLPGALRLRATIDKSWRPGLWRAITPLRLSRSRNLGCRRNPPPP
jgi:hypothetical protein